MVDFFAADLVVGDGCVADFVAVGAWSPADFLVADVAVGAWSPADFSVADVAVGTWSPADFLVADFFAGFFVAFVAEAFFAGSSFAATFFPGAFFAAFLAGDPLTTSATSTGVTVTGASVTGGSPVSVEAVAVTADAFAVGAFAVDAFAVDVFAVDACFSAGRGVAAFFVAAFFMGACFVAACFVAAFAAGAFAAGAFAAGAPAAAWRGAAVAWEAAAGSNPSALTGSDATVFLAIGGFLTADRLPAAWRALACGRGAVGSPCCFAGASTATARAGSEGRGGRSPVGGCPGSFTGGTGRRSGREDRPSGEVCERLGRSVGRSPATVLSAHSAEDSAVRVSCPATIRPTATVSFACSTALPVVAIGCLTVPTATPIRRPRGFLRAM
ncbi:MAG TPA: hypothetical protein VER39_07215 [Nocardioidaceae bacterium]|nr:hypothetical protein [Nocardioidaceae bacterium]